MVVLVKPARCRRRLAGVAVAATLAWRIGCGWLAAQDAPRLDVSLPGTPTGAVELTVLFPDGVGEPVDLFSISFPGGYAFEPATQPWSLVATQLTPQASNRASWVDAEASLAALRVYAAGYASRDQDADDLADAHEVLLHATDPDKADTDGDGLEDGEEINVQGTDPLRADTDRDGLGDGWEAGHGLDPLDDGSSDPDQGGGGDPDGDRLSNLDEQTLGTSPLSADTIHSAGPAEVAIETRTLGGWGEAGAPPGTVMYPCGDLDGVAWGSGVVYSVASGLCSTGQSIGAARRLPAADAQYVEVDRLGYRFHLATSSGRVYRVAWLEVFVPESTPAAAGHVDRAHHAVFMGDGSVMTLEAGGSVDLAGSASSSGFAIEPPVSNGITRLQLAWGGLTAYRPLTEGPGYGVPVRRRAVPDALEADPGAGIRINGDTEAGSEENDLVELELHVEPFPPPEGLAFTLTRGAPDVNVWSTPSARHPVLTTNEHAVLSVTSQTFSVWVEQVGGAESDVLLAAEHAGERLADDRARFYPFTSLLVGLGGEDQVPTDPADPNHGIYQLSLVLIDQGYDVHLYDEDLVSPDGSGAVYDKILSAIGDRGVSELALFGYSHGAGSIYHLSERFVSQGVTNVALAYTAYVDSVRNNSDVDTAQELRRPEGSLYHVNYYQEGSLFQDLGLDGGPTVDPPGADFEENRDDPTPTETHFTVDDEPEVLLGIESRLLERVTP